MANPPPCSSEELTAWFAEKLGVSGNHEVRMDREEILVVVDLGDQRADVQAHIDQYREQTRTQRMAIAEEAQDQWQRTVSWGVRCGELEARFTNVSSPVMTRLRMEERAVLDTLVDAGVARSRSDALSWCVRLVAEHQGDWIERLRDAMVAVERVRAEGPGGSAA